MVLTEENFTETARETTDAFSTILPMVVLAAKSCQIQIYVGGFCQKLKAKLVFPFHVEGVGDRYQQISNVDCANEIRGICLEPR